VTFENTSEVREAAKSVPIERIMVESDSPFLAPAPYRGKRSEPAFVRETAAFIANLRGMSLAEFAAQTTQKRAKIVRIGYVGFFGSIASIALFISSTERTVAGTSNQTQATERRSLA
jgi:hypothetical protein